MSPAEVEFFAGIYGKLDQIVGSSDLSASVEETIRLFGSAFSEDDIAALRKQAEDQAASAVRTEVRMGGALVLDYEKGKLVSIQMAVANAAAEMSGKKIFSVPAKALVEFLEHENGAPGRYRLHEAAFDNLAISLSGFTRLVSSEDFGILDKDDPLAAEKTLTLRAETYISGENGYFLISAL